MSQLCEKTDKKIKKAKTQVKSEKRIKEEIIEILLECLKPGMFVEYDNPKMNKTNPFGKYYLIFPIEEGKENYLTKEYLNNNQNKVPIVVPWASWSRIKDNEKKLYSHLTDEEQKKFTETPWKYFGAVREAPITSLKAAKFTKGYNKFLDMLLSRTEEDKRSPILKDKDDLYFYTKDSINEGFNKDKTIIKSIERWKTLTEKREEPKIDVVFGGFYLPIEPKSNSNIGDIRTEGFKANKNPLGGLLGYSRNWGKKFHGGVDLLAPNGSDVRAIYEGTVVYALSAPHEKAGYQVKLKHTISVDIGGKSYIIAEFYSTYSHLQKEFNVKKGDKVKGGEVIGKTESTGNASGLPKSQGHLHFNVYFEEEGKDKEFINPNLFFPSGKDAEGNKVPLMYFSGSSAHDKKSSKAFFRWVQKAQTSLDELEKIKKEKKK